MTSPWLSLAAVALPLLLNSCNPVEPDARLGRIILTHATREVTVTQQIVLRVKAYDLRDREITTPALQWSSHDPSIASVNEFGVVTAHRTGTAQISAASGDVSGSVDIHVDPGRLRVVMDAGSYVLTAGQVATASVQFINAEGFVVKTGLAAQWSTPDTHVVSIRPVSSSAHHRLEITALSDGMAHVSATFMDITASMALAIPSETSAESPIHHAALTFVWYLHYLPSLRFWVRPERRVELVRLDLTMPGALPAFESVCTASLLLPGQHDAVGTLTWPGGHARHVPDPYVVGLGLLTYREDGRLRSVAFEGTLASWEDFSYVAGGTVPWELCDANS